MEFIWNVEEQKLKNRNLEYMLEDYSQEEMIQAIANYNDKIDILKQIELRKQFLVDAEKGLIKESKQWVNGDRCANHYNYASLKAWCKKHGVEEKWFFNDYGDWIYLDRSSISNWSDHSAYCQLDDSEERFDKYITDIFYHTLVGLRDRERIWFNTHDEYTIEQTKYNERDKYYGFIELPVHTSQWSSGQVDVHIGDSDGVKATLEQLKALNEFYDNLDKEVKEFFTEKFKNYPIKP